MLSFTVCMLSFTVQHLLARHFLPFHDILPLWLQVKSGNGGPCAPHVAEQRDVFISAEVAADAVATFEARFTWHGFRYVEVSGLPSAFPASHVSLWGIPMRSDVPRTSFFKADDATGGRLNAIWDMVVNTHDSNMMSVQSDCPHRERFGYGGDALATSETALLLYDMGQFYSKRVRDFNEAQRSSGGFTETAPYNGISDSGLGGDSGPIGWDSVQPLLQLSLYNFYGDKRLLEESYGSTADWVRFLLAANGSLVEGGLSDWMATERKPVALIGCIFYWMNLRAWAQINTVLGRGDVAANFSALADSAKAKLNAEFLDRSTGVYKKKGQFYNSQCGQSMPLWLGLVPQSSRQKAEEALLKNLRATQHMETGMFCVKYLLLQLSQLSNEANDLAFSLINASTFPSYGYMLQQGATTLWESWFYSNDTYSHNHPMFSSVAVWLVQSLAGTLTRLRPPLE